jgi:hypothetical protein
MPGRVLFVCALGQEHALFAGPAPTYRACSEYGTLAQLYTRLRREA